MVYRCGRRRNFFWLAENIVNIITKYLQPQAESLLVSHFLIIRHLLSKVKLNYLLKLNICDGIDV